jgi:hypothetical protein
VQVEIEILRAARESPEQSVARAVHHVTLEANALAAPDDLFDQLASALTFPDYFGRNWGALYECFSDYFITEDGGLGSEFGGRSGIHADLVVLVFSHAGALLRNEAVMAADIAALLCYTRKVNANRSTADLRVEFVVHDADERAALELALTSAC